MKVLITGGNGFLGRRLAEQMVTKGGIALGGAAPEPISELLLFDVAERDLTPSLMQAGARQVVGDIGDEATVAALVDRPDMAIFHLASIVSGQGEVDFDLAMRVNLLGNLNLLNAARQLGSCPRFVFASSVAAFGGDDLPDIVSDGTKQTATTTYGVTKTMGELLVNDYSRKGFIDGRSARLPTVIVRPGKPNAAASSFFSGLFREPLAGVPMDIPVELGVQAPVAGYRSIVDGFERLMALDSAELGSDRAVGLPALNITIADLLASVKRVAQEDGLPLAAIGQKTDPVIASIVAGWPGAVNNDRATALGLRVEGSIDEIARAYIADYLERG